MFVPFLILSILSVLWFVFSISDGFFGGNELLKQIISPFFIVALFNKDMLNLFGEDYETVKGIIGH